MNDVPDAPPSADRLRCALDDSRLLRAELGTARRTARALIDALNTDLRTYVAGRPGRSGAAATGGPAGTPARPHPRATS
jgi:hypothetical protein